MTIPYNNLLDTNDKSFVWGNGLISASGQDEFYYLQDHLGSPIRLLGEDRDDVLAFDEFGVSTVEHSDNQPFGFTGYQFDNISGLQYAQARYYNPMQGRFGAEDPIKDQFNWYGYCRANPINLIDPSGLMDTADESGRLPTHTPPPFIGPQLPTNGGGIDWNHAVNIIGTPTVPSVPSPNNNNSSSVSVGDVARAAANTTGFGLGMGEFILENITKNHNWVGGNPSQVFIPGSGTPVRPYKEHSEALGKAGTILTIITTSGEIISIFLDDNLSDRERMNEVLLLLVNVGGHAAVSYVSAKVGAKIGGVTKGAGVPVGLGIFGFGTYFGGQGVDQLTELLRERLNNMGDVY